MSKDWSETTWGGVGAVNGVTPTGVQWELSIESVTSRGPCQFAGRGNSRSGLVWVSEGGAGVGEKQQSFKGWASQF